MLIDPVWGERASPFTFAGPRRFFAPPLPLAELPRGALKSATYTDGAWTLELAKVDAAALAAVDRALAARGIAALQAPTATGVRMRLVAQP